MPLQCLVLLKIYFSTWVLLNKFIHYNVINQLLKSQFLTKTDVKNLI